MAGEGEGDGTGEGGTLLLSKAGLLRRWELWREIGIAACLGVLIMDPLVRQWEWSRGPAVLSAAMRRILFMVDSALCLPGIVVALGPLALLRYLAPGLPEAQVVRWSNAFLLLGGGVIWGFTWWMIRTGVGRARWRRITVIAAWTLWLVQLFFAGLQSHVYEGLFG